MTPDRRTSRCSAWVWRDELVLCCRKIPPRPCANRRGPDQTPQCFDRVVILPITDQGFAVSIGFVPKPQLLHKRFGFLTQNHLSPEAAVSVFFFGSINGLERNGSIQINFRGIITPGSCQQQPFVLSQSWSFWVVLAARRKRSRSRTQGRWSNPSALRGDECTGNVDCQRDLFVVTKCAHRGSVMSIALVSPGKSALRGCVRPVAAIC